MVINCEELDNRNDSSILDLMKKHEDEELLFNIKTELVRISQSVNWMV